MKSTILAIIAFVFILAIILFITWFLPVLAMVALISKVIFTVIAVCFVALMSYEMMKTELELQAYRNKHLTT